MFGAGPMPPPASEDRLPVTPPPAKPRSNSCAARAVRSEAEASPSTTAISRRLPRVALATMLKPDAQMKPVFIPSAPG